MYANLSLISLLLSGVAITEFADPLTNDQQDLSMQADIEAAIEESRESVSEQTRSMIANIENLAWESQLRDRRIELCREATAASLDWPRLIRSEIAENPKLGDFSYVMEICLAYLHGQRDVLLKSDE